MECAHLLRKTRSSTLKNWAFTFCFIASDQYVSAKRCSTKVFRSERFDKRIGNPPVGIIKNIEKSKPRLNSGISILNSRMEQEQAFELLTRFRILIYLQGLSAFNHIHYSVCAAIGISEAWRVHPERHQASGSYCIWLNANMSARN